MQRKCPCVSYSRLNVLHRHPPWWAVGDTDSSTISQSSTVNITVFYFSFSVSFIHSLSVIQLPTSHRGWLQWSIVVDVVVQSLSHVQLFATPWTAACQALLPFTISWRLFKFITIELVMLNGPYLYVNEQAFWILSPPPSSSSWFWLYEGLGHPSGRKEGSSDPSIPLWILAGFWSWKGDCWSVPGPFWTFGTAGFACFQVVLHGLTSSHPWVLAPFTRDTQDV